MNTTKSRGRMSISKVLRRASSETDAMITDLQSLIRQPSVSAKGEGLEECAHLVCNMLKEAGLHAEILRVRGKAPPIVYGEIRSCSNPEKTLLFYNHYDVQPAEPFDLWRYPPFDGTRRGNKIYGRGATDDKGELVSRMRAVGAFIRETGDVPCTIKFVIEGEEEIGSTHIKQYLKRYRQKFACDGIIWEFGNVDADGRPVVGLGMKGLMFVELTCKRLARDAHSSLAVLLPNPAWRLVEALSTMRTPDGKIMIKGWYDEVRPFTTEDLNLLKAERFDESKFKAEFGVDSFLGGKKGIKARMALAGDATCNIAGIVSGYTKVGAKTVLPALATVKLDFRLTPDMIPAKQFERLQTHLAENGFTDIKAIMLHGEAAARTAPSEQMVSDVRCAANAVFGDSVLSISNPATGPMHAFSEMLQAPCVSVGGTHVFARIHSPNEFARIDLLKKTTYCICRIMDNFARS